MKRIVWIMAIALSSVTMSFAAEGNVVKKTFKMEFSQLCSFLNLAPSQWGKAQSINDYFVYMQDESLQYGPKLQKEKMQRAIKDNLRLMKTVLTDEQYRSYVTLLNVANVSDQLIPLNPSPELLLADN